MSDRGNVILRHIDRYGGIPLVFLTGLFKRKNRDIPANPRRIGILATAAIGDTLLMSAVLKDLKSHWPDAELVVFAGKTNYAMVQLCCPFDRVEKIEINNPVGAVRHIRQTGRYDIWLDFGPWPRLNALLSAFVKAKVKVGFKSIKQYRHYAYDISVDHRDDCHELDNLRRLVQVCGVSSLSVPELGKADPDREHPYTVVHMFPSGYKASYKEWSDSCWVELINGLTEAGTLVKITGAPKDSETANRIVSLCNRQENIEVLAGKTNLSEAAEVLKRASLVISVNTGIMHMAAAYNCRIIALHGPTSPLRWGPVCEEAVNFCATSSSAGCLHLGFEYDDKDPHSMETIDPREVLKAALSD